MILSLLLLSRPLNLSKIVHLHHLPKSRVLLLNSFHLQRSQLLLTSPRPIIPVFLLLFLEHHSQLNGLAGLFGNLVRGWGLVLGRGRPIRCLLQMLLLFFLVGDGLLPLLGNVVCLEVVGHVVGVTEVGWGVAIGDAGSSGGWLVLEGCIVLCLG